MCPSSKSKQNKTIELLKERRERFKAILVVRFYFFLVLGGFSWMDAVLSV